jgi:predicted DNA-binding transcriptional regulator AlpA
VSGHRSMGHAGLSGMIEVSLMRLADVSHATGIGKSTIRRLVVQGEFPAPIRLVYPKITVWKSDEVQGWINEATQQGSKIALGVTAQS